MKKSNLFPKVFLFSGIGLILAFLVFIAGFSLGSKGNLSLSSIKSLNIAKPANVDFSLYWEAWEKKKEKSVFDTPDSKKIYGSITGLLQSAGDPYTTFFTPEENKRFKEDIQGQFSGVGVELIEKNGMPTIVAPLSATPAEKAGLKAGDIIAEVDGKSTADMGFGDVVNAIRGQEGTNVKLKIIREGVDQPFDVEVTRQNIAVKSVEWKTQEWNGKQYMIVNIRQFGDDTDGLFDSFVDEAVKQKPDGIIVDLRNNPGGYLQTAINLSSYFLDGGTVVKEQGKDGQSKDYSVTRRARLKDYNLAVLVNKGSASASEIFSGAVQDRHEGKLIGEKTFGKGSVQELIDLSNGAAVKITVAKWLTPNGRQINEQGIEPDIQVTDNSDSSNNSVLNRAFEYLKTGK